jgi:PEP-CTERM motif
MKRIDGDGAVTNADIQLLLNLLKVGVGSATQVPEPATIVLMALAALLLIAPFCARRTCRRHLADTARAVKRTSFRESTRESESVDL